MAAFVQSDFDTQCQAIDAALVAGNKQAALLALARANNIQKYLFKSKLSDAGSEVMRWDYGQQLKAIQDYFAALYESQGTSAENVIPQPVSAEGGTNFSSTLTPPIARYGS